MAGAFARAVTGATILFVAACGIKPSPVKSALLEVLSLQGSCKADEASRWDAFNAVIVRRVDKLSGLFTIYGFAYPAHDIVISALDVAQAGKYQRLEEIKLSMLQHVDLNSPILTLRGEMDLDSQPQEALASTCKMKVLKRTSN